MQYNIHKALSFFPILPCRLFSQGPTTVPCHVTGAIWKWSSRTKSLFIGSIWKWKATLFHIKHTLSRGGVSQSGAYYTASSSQIKEESESYGTLPRNTLKLFWKSNYCCFLYREECCALAVTLSSPSINKISLGELGDCIHISLGDTRGMEEGKEER